MDNKHDNKIKKTFCRICEAYCGLEVTVSQSDEISNVKPDKSHAISKGYACIKGISIDQIHTDPDRVNYPLKRINGQLKRISWKQANQEIGSKIRALRTEYGDRSIGMYQGNPTFFNYAGMLFSDSFLEALGSPNLYSSHSIDCNNKFEVSTHIYGLSTVHPIVDLDHTKFLICLGGNPMVSQMSFISVINPLEKMKSIIERGGRVLSIDPKKTETSEKVGEHLFIKPGSDVFLLLAMLNLIAHEHTIDIAQLSTVADGVEKFMAIADGWTPERVAAITGINADEIRTLTRDFVNSDGGALYMSTGVNMGRFGTLSYWLVNGINLLTGNIDKQGGLLVPYGVFDALKLGKEMGLGDFNGHQTLKNGWHQVAGNFPVSALADEITIDHPERIRALFISAGNPIHSMPNGDVLSDAMKKLDLVVSIDIFQNETSKNADYILPATDMLERSDYPMGHVMLQNRPFAQFTDPVVKPKYERREEWRIFSDLAIASGADRKNPGICNLVAQRNKAFSRVPFVSKHLIKPHHILASLLKSGGQTTLKALKQTPQGMHLRENTAGSFLGHRVPTKNGKVQLWSDKLSRDLDRARIEHQLDEKHLGKLQLVGQRDRRTHNSWMQNNTKIKQPDRNHALINSKDAEERQVQQGDLVCISTELGEVQLPATVTDHVFKGVIVVPHGWGHGNNDHLSKASSQRGININSILPGGHENQDPISGQAIMTGHYVSVKKWSSNMLTELNSPTDERNTL